MLRRVHGGAVPSGALTMVEPGLGERHGTRAEHKRQIARAAIGLLPGREGSLILDGGTTTAALADVLPADRRLYLAGKSGPIAPPPSAASGGPPHPLRGRGRGRTPTPRGRPTPPRPAGPPLAAGL